MRIKVPRYANAEWFALREGELRNWHGWVIKEKLGPDNSYDNLSFNGNCVQCADLGLPDAYCQGSYSGFRDNAHLKHYHCGLIYIESDTGALLEDSDVFTAVLLGDKYQYRYRSDSETHDPCYDCGDFSNPKQMTLNAIEYIQSKQEAEDVDQIATFEFMDVNKKWFRDFWNSLVPEEDKVAPDEPAPIEPMGDVYKFFYALLTEQRDTVYHGNTGWCHPFGASSPDDCLAATECYLHISTPWPTWVHLGWWWYLQGPNASYPVYFKKNGVVMDWYPGGLGHIAYHDVNNM